MRALLRKLSEDIVGQQAELEKARQRWPGVRVLWNFACIAATQGGDPAEARHLIVETYRRFPNYTFAFANYVMLLVQNGELEAAKEVIGDRWALTKLDPGRRDFHIGEHLAFEQAMAMYLWKKGDREEAMRRVEQMEEVAGQTEMIDRLLGQMLSGWDGMLYMLEQVEAARRGEAGESNDMREAWDEIERMRAMPLEQLRELVPPHLRERFHAIVERTDAVCEEHLDQEYRALARVMAVELCQEGTPAVRGKPESWAAGILYALGSINFLSDSSFPPTMTLSDVTQLCGVSAATGSNKARDIRELLDVEEHAARWMMDDRRAADPRIWFVERPDGMIVDLRWAPREVKEAAFRVGLIPFVPESADGEDSLPGAILG